MSTEESSTDFVKDDRLLASELEGLQVTGIERCSSYHVSPSSVTERCSSPEELVFYAKAPFNGGPEVSEQCTLKRGDKVQVIERTNSCWWWASVGDQVGWVPTNHLCTSEELQELLSEIWQDDEYFGSYGPLKLHREMLGDVPRTRSYQRAVECCSSHIEGKVVLDVGCGTGILSMFCARDGKARKVYAVEASDVSERAEEIIRHNKLDDRVVVIRGKVEDINVPEKVDLIISEWMGTLLLFELMLESVLRARDRFLKPGGVMWPSHASLYLVPCSAHRERTEKVEFWANLYGFDFSVLQPAAMEETFSRPIFNHQLEPENCLSSADSILQLDLGTVCVSDLEEWSYNFDFKVLQRGMFHGFASWFDVTFGGWPKQTSDETVVLCTGPNHPRTHWQQDLFLMDNEVEVIEDDALHGMVRIWRHPDWRRHLRILFTFDIVRTGALLMHIEKKFCLWK